MHLRNILKHSKALVLVGAVLVAGCDKNTASRGLDGQFVVNNDPNANRVIGEGANRFSVLGSKALQEAVRQKKVKLTDTSAADKMLSSIAASVSDEKLAKTSNDAKTNRDDSLVVGFPLGLIGERQVFGGVITTVSDTESEQLGDLKLTDLPPLHVKTVIAKASEKKYILALLGCTEKCTEGSADEPLISFPVVGVDEEKQMVMVDLAAVGDSLNLIKMLDPDGSYTKLKTESSKTVALDYSLSTLVFDVQATMVPVDAKEDGESDEAKKDDATDVKKTIFTTRWYLRLGSVFNPAFEPRSAAPGVGFFMTERGATPHIERHSLSTTFTNELPAELHYYVVNVPKDHQPAFASAFDEWNDTFEKISGRKLFSYDFVDATDAKAKQLVPGDVRYNILQWDLVNQASYGGLGPSIANQFTGEILSSNVLIQGPTVVEIYTKWFAANKRAEVLRSEGRDAEAENLLAVTEKALRTQQAAHKAPEIKLSLGNRLNFRVASQRPELEDPAMSRQDFDPVPAGVTFESYMKGYFHDMVTHELGHNLGLRHNFRGSLFAEDGEPKQGKVSVSIMEYLGRGFRHLDQVGEYDVMALSYGYLGIKPTRTDQFCTDEDQASAMKVTNSPECNKDDATNDPFSFLEQRLGHAIDLLIARGSNKAPSWKVEEMVGQLNPTLAGLANYAVTAEATADEWTNFFGKLDRPSDKSKAKSYVLDKLKAKICDGSVAQVAAGKESDEAKAAVLKNMEELEKLAGKTLAPYKLFGDAGLKCAP
jgi:hypothetical protein